MHLIATRKLRTFGRANFRCDFLLMDVNEWKKKKISVEIAAQNASVNGLLNIECLLPPYEDERCWFPLCFAHELL